MDLAYIEGLLEYAFQDRSYLLEALHAPGSGLDRVGNRAIPDGNRRLAMLGDAVIKSVILDGWYSTQEERGRSR